MPLAEQSVVQASDDLREIRRLQRLLHLSGRPWEPRCHLPFIRLASALTLSSVHPA